jgi:hypothetical protein
MSACTVSSVSISNPADRPEKDFTKRREKTRYPDSVSTKERRNTAVMRPVSTLFPVRRPRR